MEKKPVDVKQSNMSDYRFSLANERTFLAWIRTALAFLVVAFAVDNFMISKKFPALPMIYAMVLAAISAGLVILALIRFQANERAIAKGEKLPSNHLVTILSVCVLIMIQGFVIFSGIFNH